MDWAHLWLTKSLCHWCTLPEILLLELPRNPLSRISGKLFTGTSLTGGIHYKAARCGWQETLQADGHWRSWEVEEPGAGKQVREPAKPAHQGQEAKLSPSSMTELNVMSAGKGKIVKGPRSTVTDQAKRTYLERETEHH